LYEGIKFQCSNCGLRFIRNEQLKAHLDTHFVENNQVRKKSPVNPVKQENRPLFNTFMGWVRQPPGEVTPENMLNDPLMADQGQANQGKLLNFSVDSLSV
jgi:hypothetical protein